MSTLTKEHLYMKFPSFTIYFSLTYFNIEKHIETLEAMLCGMCTGEVYINAHIKDSIKKQIQEPNTLVLVCGEGSINFITFLLGKVCELTPQRRFSKESSIAKSGLYLFNKMHIIANIYSTNVCLTETHVHYFK